MIAFNYSASSLQKKKKFIFIDLVFQSTTMVFLPSRLHKLETKRKRDKDDNNHKAKECETCGFVESGEQTWRQPLHTTGVV